MARFRAGRSPRREGLRLPDREAAAAPVILLAAFGGSNERYCDEIARLAFSTSRLQPETTPVHLPGDRTPASACLDDRFGATSGRFFDTAR